MKFMRKYAELTGYTLYHGNRINDWRCPNKKCGMGVSEDYKFCPYCGQKIRFADPSKAEMIKISRKLVG